MSLSEVEAFWELLVLEEASRVGDVEYETLQDGSPDILLHYAMKEDNPVLKYLREGWVVKSCSWKEGNIERGEAPKVLLGLAPPPEAVFWPNDIKH